PKFSHARVACGMRTARAARGDSASCREGERILQAIVAPKNFRTDCERRRAENAELTRSIRRLLRETLALRALRAGDDRRRWFVERGKNMLDVIADTRRAPTDEPGVKCGTRVVVTPFFLRGDEAYPQREEVGIGWVRRPAGERDVVAARASLDVVPKVIHLHVVLRECGI